ncbi:PREDICTED: uncharacterized protein LOC106815367 [Priapulus caudatus]|uniref:Uncharacterized protein LOC106815367 n=1 Tax=Priapulus caudatus TaxID=37621 RepID=A0ABM1ESY4_PRICU|nr:PREDICTED: uncharacterized protein LOC106815367 [Priapulus caudatus]
MAIRHIKSLSDRNKRSGYTIGPLGWNGGALQQLDLIDGAADHKGELESFAPSQAATPSPQPPPAHAAPMATSISQVLQQSMGIEPKNFQPPDNGLVLHPKGSGGGGGGILQRDARYSFDLLTQVRERSQSPPTATAAPAPPMLYSPTATAAPAPPMLYSPTATETSDADERSRDSARRRSGSASPKSDRTVSPPCMLPAKHNLLQRYHADRSSPERGVAAGAPAPAVSIKREFDYRDDGVGGNKRACRGADAPDCGAPYAAAAGNGLRAASGGRATPESSVDAAEHGGDGGATYLPAFVMHPSGNYYVPLPVAHDAVVAALQAGADKFAVTYPISINVKIGTPAPPLGGLANSSAAAAAAAADRGRHGGPRCFGERTHDGL